MDNTSDDQSNAQLMCWGWFKNQLLELFSLSDFLFEGNLQFFGVFFILQIGLIQIQHFRFQLHLPVCLS